jgi:hypothetical protein
MTAMAARPVTKLDFKRVFKELYAPSKTPAMVDVPELTFLMIDGAGDPNTSQDYKDAVEALYAVSYGLKFAIKRSPDGFDYGVMPLEAQWWVDDMSTFSVTDKAAWQWTAMIMQPDEVTIEQFEDAVDKAVARKSLRAASKLRLERFREGRAAQVLHLGPYRDEGPTIDRLHAFIADQGNARAGKHHEIYLSDARRTAPERLKTVIRQPVE